MKWKLRPRANGEIVAQRAIRAEWSVQAESRVSARFGAFNQLYLIDSLGRSSDLTLTIEGAEVRYEVTIDGLLGHVSPGSTR